MAQDNKKMNDNLTSVILTSEKTGQNHFFIFIESKQENPSTLQKIHVVKNSVQGRRRHWRGTLILALAAKNIATLVMGANITTHNTIAKYNKEWRWRKTKKLLTYNIVSKYVFQVPIIIEATKRKREKNHLSALSTYNYIHSRFRHYKSTKS